MNYFRSRGLLNRKCKEAFWRTLMPSVMAACLFAAGSSPAQTIITACTEQALRNALAGGGIVLFGSTCTNEISISSPITVNGDVTLDAAGHAITLTGRGSNQIFTVNGHLKLVGINLVNGKAQYGGAVFVNSNATFTAQDCTFSGNFAGGPAGSAGVTGDNVSYGTAGKGGDGATGGPARGGAIYNYLGSVTLSACKLLNNGATAGKGGNGGNGGNSAGSVGRGGDGGLGGAGGAAHGGAIYNAGDLTILNCTFSVNEVTGGSGGAGGTNGAGAFPGQTGAGGQGGPSFGGAIYNAYNLAASGNAFSSNAAQGGNSAAGGTQATGRGTRGQDGAPAGGGALANGWYGAMTNCTFYANTARGGNGGNGGDGSGSIPNKGDGGNGGDGVGGGIQSWSNLYVSFCTLVSCGAYGGSNGVPGNGVFNGQNGLPGAGLGGNFAATGSGTTLLGTLVGWPAAGAAAYGTVADDGYNMIPDSSISLGSRSFPNTAFPKLGTFGNNAGPTPTIPLLTNSPAVDKVPAELSPATDQRGVQRPTDGGTGNDLSDIGAFELAPVSPPVIVENPAPTNATLGSSVTLQISATGAEPLRYQWQFKGSNIAGATGPSYTVTNLSATNNGPYRVIVSNLFGTATSQAMTIGLRVGSVLEGTNGIPLTNATIAINMNGTNLSSPTILPDGSFTGSSAAGIYTLTPALTNYVFVPPSVTLTNPPGGTNVQFVGYPLIRIATNSDGVLLTGGGITGVPYVLMMSATASTNAANWIPVATNTAPVQFLQPTTNAAGFYRLAR